MNSLLQDFRFGLRMLIKNPIFTLIAIATLALGIGANTAIFSVVDAVLLRPLPYPEANRLVFLWSTMNSQGVPLSSSALPDYQGWRDHNQSFSGHTKLACAWHWAPKNATYYDWSSLKGCSWY